MGSVSEMLQGLPGPADALTLPPLSWHFSLVGMGYSEGGGAGGPVRNSQPGFAIVRPRAPPPPPLNPIQRRALGCFRIL